MSYRPSLRPHVVRLPTANGGELHDPVLDRALAFGAGSWAVVQALDGARDVEAVAAAVAPAVSRDEAEHTLRTLALLNLTRGAGDAIVATVEKLARGEAALAPRLLPEARFACQGSGDCCHNFALGPLRDEDVERLDALPLAAAFPRLGGAPAWETRSDRPGRFLRTVDGGCIFLDGARCGLHARFGAASKPAMCRLFPLEELATIDGVRVSDRGTCASFAVSSRSGLPLAVELPEWVAPLLQKSPPLYHPVVALGGGAACDYGHWLAFQDALVALAGSRRGGPTATLRAVGRWTRDFGRALAACPLADGEPDATVRKVIAVEVQQYFAPPSERRAGLEAIGFAASELLRATSNDGAFESLLLRRRAADLSRALGLVVQLAQAALAGERPPMPAIGDEHDELFRISLRQQLFGRRALVDRRPAAGLVRLALCHLVTRAGARMRAGGDGRERVGVDDLSFGHTLAFRVLGPLDPELFVAHEARAWDILEALDALD